MKCVILAAGIASRLRPLTNDTPKCLLEIGNKTILGRTLDNLLDNGINDFVIVTGYLESKIKEFVSKNYSALNIEFIYNEKYDSTNNIYSLWLCKESVRSSDILLLDSDIIFDRRIIPLLLKSSYENCLAVRLTAETNEEEMKVAITGENEIKNISKKIDLNEADGESIGIEKFNNRFVNELYIILDRMILEEGKSNVFYEAAFEKAMENGNSIYAVDLGSYRCVEVDTAEDIEHAEMEIIKYLK
ncbi:bifunctional IPC transferase and DIPP synthase [bacterium BMS3Abin04]|nr:bifunctional IPC transferase and DIPP synthase [bacterium BMS3Abin04]